MRRGRRYHFALPSTSSIPGLEDLTLPSVAVGGQYEAVDGVRGSTLLVDAVRVSQEERIDWTDE